jgi:hypothetical protein
MPRMPPKIYAGSCWAMGKERRAKAKGLPVPLLKRWTDKIEF